MLFSSMTPMIDITIKGVYLRFATAPEVFSPRSIDAGTLAMLSAVEFDATDKVLDLGCGYGVVGILAARLIGPERVVMLDNDETSVRLAKQNAELNGVPAVKVVRSDGFAQLDDAGFTLILCNPPYHSDFAVASRFITKGFNRLVLGGRMCLVTSRYEWYRNKLISLFGGVTRREIDGYHVLTSVKKSHTWAKAQTHRPRADGRSKPAEG